MNTLKKFAMTFSLVCVWGLASSACSSAAPLSDEKSHAIPTTFAECLKVPHKILKTLPPQCVTNEGLILVDKSPSSQLAIGCTNLCGNGTCEEMVCMGEGCPCAETADFCPADCKK